MLALLCAVSSFCAPGARLTAAPAKRLATPTMVWQDNIGGVAGHTTTTRYYSSRGVAWGNHYDPSDYSSRGSMYGGDGGPWSYRGWGGRGGYGYGGWGCLLYTSPSPRD